MAAPSSKKHEAKGVRVPNNQSNKTNRKSKIINKKYAVTLSKNRVEKSPEIQNPNRYQRIGIDHRRDVFRVWLPLV
jgi:hypothetical protein